MSVVRFVCCQVEVAASVWSLMQRNLIDTMSLRVNECDQVQHNTLDLYWVARRGQTEKGKVIRDCGPEYFWFVYFTFFCPHVLTIFASHPYGKISENFSVNVARFMFHFSVRTLQTQKKKLYFRDFWPDSYTLIEGYGGILFFILRIVFIFWRHFISDVENRIMFYV
jgi:hypothetical protein